MLEHGGRLNAAATRYGIPVADWVDLSTGIAPYAYPVPPLPASSWQRLPECDDGLEQVACAYYGVERCLPLPGSQAAIQLLPRLRSASVVSLLPTTYSEYAAGWQRAGHRVNACPANDLLHAATVTDVIMLGNPNNPTGQTFGRDQLLLIASELHRHGGWLVIDEAFADSTHESPTTSMAALAGTNLAPNLIVLRSIGKFFGLAGARVGFMMAQAGLLDAMAEEIGPWAIAHPSRVAACAALADFSWQREQRQRLHDDSRRLTDLFRVSGLENSSGSELFRYLETRHAEKMQDFFAQRGILLRLFNTPLAVRIGLPATESAWQRLTTALLEWKIRE